MLLSHHLIKLEDLKQMKKEIIRIKQECQNFKKGYGHIHKRMSDTESPQFIYFQKETYSIHSMYQTFGYPEGLITSLSIK